MFNIYEGYRNQDGVTDVTVNNRPLNPYKNYKDFNGFQLTWGFKVPGAKQLAYAILMEEYKNKDFAALHWDTFLNECIANLWNSRFKITTDTIKEFFLERDITFDYTGYQLFMQRCREYEEENLTTGCEDCTGGIVAQICCSGYDCGCMGLPCDYKACPNGCEAPDWFIV